MQVNDLSSRARHLKALNRAVEGAEFANWALLVISRTLLKEIYLL